MAEFRPKNEWPPTPRRHPRWREITSVLQIIEVHLFFKSHDHIRKEKIGPARAESDLPQEKCSLAFGVLHLKKIRSTSVTGS